MKHSLFIILTFFLFKANSQTKDSTKVYPYQSKYKNAATVSIGDLGGVYSFGYERIVLNKKNALYIGESYSYTPNIDFYMRHSFITKIGGIIGSKSHKLDYGVIGNFYISDVYKKYPENDKPIGLFYGAQIGYRFQNPDRRFMFKTHFILYSHLHTENKGIFTWGSMTFGYRF